MQCIIKAGTALISSLLLAACSHGIVNDSSPAPATAASSASALTLAPGLDVGMWVWHREEVVDPAERARLISFCQTYGITRLFVQVRFDKQNNGYTLATPEAWQALLAAAAKAGVQVEALDGGNAMGFAENRADTLAKLDAVLAFHRAQPASARFAGVHYDIEPYTSARWKAGELQPVMREFLETAVALRAAVRAADPKLTISHDIPAFYDGQDKYLVEFEGARKNLHEHIQDVSDYVGVMSYRTRATGPNSVSAISAAELAHGAKIGQRVYLSLETVPLKETPQITFHGRTPEEYRATIRELQAHLSANPEFGGLLLHQYRTIRTLLEKETAQR